VIRVLLIVWLAAFAVQSTELLAAVVPDDCVEDVRGTTDDCPQSCARCVCCARLPIFVTKAPAPAVLDVPARPVADSTPDSMPAADPRGVLHVPKPL
jgi:hypothetical protein